MYFFMSWDEDSIELKDSEGLKSLNTGQTWPWHMPRTQLTDIGEKGSHPSVLNLWVVTTLANFYLQK